MSKNEGPKVGDALVYHHATSDGQPRGDFDAVVTVVHSPDLVDVQATDAEGRTFERANVPFLTGETLPADQKSCRAKPEKKAEKHEEKTHHKAHK